MDPFTMLRLSSLFAPSPSGVVDPNADAGPPIQPSAGVSSDMNDDTQQMNPDVSGMMAKLYQPDTSASDYLKQVLNSQPQAPKAGLLRKLIAGGLGAIKDTENTRMEPVGVRPTETGQEVTNNFLGLPQYQQAVANWRQQLAGAESAANTERASNANQRMAANQNINDILKQQHENEIERHNLISEQVAQQRAQIQQFAAQNRDWQFTAPKGGNYTFINKLTGEKKDTGVPTGTLSQLDEMNLSASNAMVRTDVTAGSKNWTIGEINDPNDPTGQKKISVRMNSETGEVQPIKYGGQQVDANKTGNAPPVDNAAVTKQNQEIQDKTRESLSVIDELMDDKNNLKSNAGLGLVGFGMRHIPGTEAYNNVVAINRLKGMLTLDLINQMRAASKSGSTGFGRITNQEINLLQNAASQLDPSQSPEKFQEQLRVIKEKLNKVLLPNDSQSPTATAVPGSTKKPTAADLIKKYGGGTSNDEDNE